MSWVGHWVGFILNAQFEKTWTPKSQNKMLPRTLEHLKFKTPNPHPQLPHMPYSMRLTFPGRSPRTPDTPWEIARARGAQQHITPHTPSATPLVSIRARFRRTTPQRICSEEGSHRVWGVGHPGTGWLGCRPGAGTARHTPRCTTRSVTTNPLYSQPPCNPSGRAPTIDGPGAL